MEMGQWEQIASRSQELQSQLGYKETIHVVYFSTSGGRIFFILSSNQHAQVIEDRLNRMTQSPWQKHFKLYTEMKAF